MTDKEEKRRAAAARAAIRREKAKKEKDERENELIRLKERSVWFVNPEKFEMPIAAAEARKKQDYWK